MTHWTLLTPLRFLRGALHLLALPATAVGMLAAGTAGALVPLVVVRGLGVESGLIQGAVAIACGLSAMIGAYVAGDRLNERIRRLRAPMGSASIGVDGLRWRHFGKTEFVSWAVVRDVGQRGAEVTMNLEGRAPVVLLVRDAELFADAARRALSRYREAPAPEAIPALEFAGESVADWLGRARELLRGGTYRDAGVDEEQCVRVAVDPRAAIAQRIGSVAALSHASDDARGRVRVAIEDTADPLVSSALEDALEGRDDDHAMRKAMDRSSS